MSARRTPLSLALIATLMTGLVSCAAAPEAPREYLDPSTAATISVVGKPLVFCHERPELAVHMRDYVTVAAAAVNRQGVTDYVLIAYFWTTFDAQGRSGDELRSGNAPTRSDSAPPPARLLIAADDRIIALEWVAHSTREAGIGVLVHAPPGPSFVAGVYRTELATLRFLAAARRMELLRDENDSDSRYSLWDDERAPLGAFVRRLSGAD